MKVNQNHLRKNEQMTMQVCASTPVIPTPVKWRKQDQGFKAILSYKLPGHPGAQTSSKQTNKGIDGKSYFQKLEKEISLLFSFIFKSCIYVYRYVQV